MTRRLFLSIATLLVAALPVVASASPQGQPAAAPQALPGAGPPPTGQPAPPGGQHPPPTTEQRVINSLNPSSHFSQKEYLTFWNILFTSVLEGIWARVGAVTSLILSFWFGVRRQQMMMGIMFFATAIAFAYGASLLRLCGLL